MEGEEERCQRRRTSGRTLAVSGLSSSKSLFLTSVGSLHLVQTISSVCHPRHQGNCHGSYFSSSSQGPYGRIFIAVVSRVDIWKESCSVFTEVDPRQGQINLTCTYPMFFSWVIGSLQFEIKHIFSPPEINGRACGEAVRGEDKGHVGYERL